METRLSNVFKTTNITKLDKAISENCCAILQVTAEWKTLKQPVHSLKVIAIWSTFDIQIDITWAIFWEKLKNYSF